MHPMTLYDAALRDHARQSAERDRAHRRTVQRRVRRPGSGPADRPSPTPARHVARSRRSATGTQPQRPTADQRSAADGHALCA